MHRTFTLTISTERATFDGKSTKETAQILKDVAEKVALGHRGGEVTDTNGAVIGYYGFGAHGVLSDFYPHNPANDPHNELDSTSSNVIRRGE
jgi:hypothetical protein